MPEPSRSHIAGREVSLNLPKPDQITIAVTVFERTEYIAAAIESALRQTVPVRVIVVEDCASTNQVRELVDARFQDQITYYRNPTRRGIFGNWNACCDYAGTEWISILHDDDLLAPTFIADMLQLSRSTEPAGAYFCRPNVLTSRGEIREIAGYDFPSPWRRLDLTSFAEQNRVLFPGQLLHVPSVRAVGGFKEKSHFAGDWDMWFKLAFHCGAAQTHAVCATVRIHEGEERGTNRVVRSGRKLALDYIQARRNFALLREKLPEARFDRDVALAESPVSTRELLHILPNLSPRMARYQWGLLMRSTPPSARYACIQQGARVAGPYLLQTLTRMWKSFAKRDSQIA